MPKPKAKAKTIKNKNILIVVTGSIAAYKSAILVRGLIKEGADVRVVMTPGAEDFITPLTLSTLSRSKVHRDISSGDEWNNHVELGLWADLMIVAPATANTLAKMANGICDNMLLATYLSAKCPVWLAPAMDLDMWRHPSTQRNIQKLNSDKIRIIDVNEGELASGLHGPGRMAEPHEIIEVAGSYFSKSKELAGKKYLVTAGPTYEAIDPVRFIGNRSSGKMGIEIAERLSERGAQVNLVLGPSNLHIEGNNIEIERVESAEDMFQAVRKQLDKQDGFIMAAAVADYSPAEVETRKMKKADHNLNLELKKTTDIAGWVGQRKIDEQLLIGFALETDHELENARSKRSKKNMDMIVLNSLRDPDSGFFVETNKVTLISSHEEVELPLMQKSEVASWIVDWMIENKVGQVNTQ
jgi:phosphopantothenoylcysteine decarboxylase/phosphopantothenate--cysteine ligase